MPIGARWIVLTGKAAFAFLAVRDEGSAPSAAPRGRCDGLPCFVRTPPGCP